MLLYLLEGMRKKGYPTLSYTTEPADLPRLRSVCDWVTMDKKHFRKVLFSPRTKGAVAAIDECADSLDRHDDDDKTFATRSRRHAQLIFSVQHAADVNRTIRSQCTQVITFMQDEKDAEFLAREWGMPELRAATRLKQFEYLQATKFGKGVHRGSIKPR